MRTSWAMNIQDVIAKLSAIKEEYGNIPVLYAVQSPVGWSYVDPRFIAGDLKNETAVVIMP